MALQGWFEPPLEGVAAADPARSVTFVHTSGWNWRIMEDYYLGFAAAARVELCGVASEAQARRVEQRALVANHVVIFVHDVHGFQGGSMEFARDGRVWLMNPEQLSSRRQSDRLVRLMLAGWRVFDYSSANVRVLSDRFQGVLALARPVLTVPVQFTAEQEHLAELLRTTPKEYDVAFVGSLIHRRVEVLNALGNAGLRVLVANGFRDDRDKKIASARVLVNVHAEDAYQIFEHIRCDRWILAGHVVVSEPSAMQESLDLWGTWVSSPSTGDLVSTVKAVLDDLPGTQGRLRSRWEAIRDQVLHKRRSALQRVVGP
jgi:hypothetical protein